jgi:large subunit ribosomal protein L3
MVVGLLGRKLGMTQIYEEGGTAVPVTVIEAGPCTVLQIRTRERDGYESVQLGFLDKPRRVATKAERGHVAKVNAEPKRYVREFRTDGEQTGLAEGQAVTVEIFKDVKAVDIIGTSKGKGTAGPMKRHNFQGLPASHGVKRKHRAPGAIGGRTDPGRVFKGHRMAGQMGGVRSTMRNLRVVRIEPEQNLLLVRGAVPGPNGGYVMIRKTNKI